MPQPTRDFAPARSVAGSCRMCKFWDIHELAKQVNPDSARGDCIRFPPAPVVLQNRPMAEVHNEIRYVFPVTEERSVCGEYEPVDARVRDRRLLYVQRRGVKKEPT